MSDAARPNILWICTDQQRHDTIHALGNRWIRTPNLDRLVAAGVAFTRAYCQSPICTPSRASFLTGCYPDRIHQHRNGNASFSANVPLGTKILADAGYDCGLVGKLHLAGAYERVEPRFDDGYRYFAWSHHRKPEPFLPDGADAYQSWLSNKAVNWESAHGAEIPAGWETGGYFQAGIAAEHHQTTWCAEETIAFLSEPREGPWLVSVNPNAPHPPFDPPPDFLTRMDPTSVPAPLFEPHDLDQQERLSSIDFQSRPQAPDTYDSQRMVAAYYAQIEFIDAQVGRILDALERTGQRDNTIVMFMSDHGEMLGDHGLRLKGCRFYEGLVHIPLIVSWPGKFRQGVQCAELVELVDVLPTLLEAAGLPNPEHIQGRSLLPILQAGSARPGPHRDLVRCDYFDTLELPAGSRATMVFDGHHKQVIYHGTGLGELYDLTTDPGEFNNLWDHPFAADIRHSLLAHAFDAFALSADTGSKRIGRF